MKLRNIALKVKFRGGRIIGVGVNVGIIVGVLVGVGVAVGVEVGVGVTRELTSLLGEIDRNWANAKLTTRIMATATITMFRVR